MRFLFATLLPASRLSSRRTLYVSPLRYGPHSASEALELWSNGRATSDFKVSELGLDGALASLPPGEEVNSEFVLIAPSSPALKEPEPEPPTTEELKLAIEFAKDNGGDAEMLLPASSLTKEERGAFHKSLRAACGDCVDSKTEGDSIRVWRKKNASKNRIGSDSGGKARWNPDASEYLLFVMAKERLTTLDAIESLAKRLHCKPARFAYAGLKDKIASTAQYISLWRPPTDAPQRLQDQSRTPRGAALTVGRFATADAPLRLGGLVGNRFEVTLRGVSEAGVAHLQARALEVTQGALNSYGKQRFGVGAISNVRVGAAVLHSDFDAAVLLALDRALGDLGAGKLDDPRVISRLTRLTATCSSTSGSSSSSQVTGMKVVNDRETIVELVNKQETGDQENSSNGSSQPDLNIRFTSPETKLMAATLESAGNPQRVFGVLPRQLRRLYVESWQSELWNALATYRACSVGVSGAPTVMEGDLIMVRADNEAMGVSAWEAAIAGRGESVVRRANAADAGAGSGVDASAVVVPMLGSEVDLPEWATEEILVASSPGGDVETIALAQATHRAQEYTLKGSYRHVWATPRHLEVDAASAAETNGKVVVQFDLPPAAFATELLAKLVASGHKEGNKGLDPRC